MIFSPGVLMMMPSILWAPQAVMMTSDVFILFFVVPVLVMMI
jgi:hypothetical protein